MNDKGKMVWRIICVDFQKEFTSPEGKWFNPGKSVPFIKETLVPYCRDQDWKIAEIISDYRQPRPGDAGDGCHPGTPGFVSEIPGDVTTKRSWIKCMNSPIWVRENIGLGNQQPGLPYQDPLGFTDWLNRTVGTPKDVKFVTLIGLTVDWCVFCTAQELSWRGYDVKILAEGTDAVNGDLQYKKQLLTRSPLLNWADVITWDELRKRSC
jgi:nicotinamidase-related amidase